MIRQLVPVIMVWSTRSAHQPVQERVKITSIVQNAENHVFLVANAHQVGLRSATLQDITKLLFKQVEINSYETATSLW